MPNKPILLLTFAANNLQGVKTEADKIWKSVKKNTAITAKKVNNATLDSLAESIIDCGKDLFMFHFGGHADPQSLVLDHARGAVKDDEADAQKATDSRDIHRINLSRLLVRNENHKVQIVFLNGCQSYGHVGILTAKGVKAIIATNVKVNDVEAVRVAAFFYKLFFEKDYTLKEAFETAVATVGGNTAYITIVNPGEIDENQPLTSSWTLFIHAKHKDVMDWALAEFLKGNDTKTTAVTGTTQTHSGSGDNVAGNKIGRQINMGASSTYIENQTAMPTPPPKTLNFKDTIKSLVSNGKLSEALKQIATKSDENHTILLQSRLSRLERDENLGTMDARDANIERNRITQSILSLLGDLS